MIPLLPTLTVVILLVDIGAKPFLYVPIVRSKIIWLLNFAKFSDLLTTFDFPPALFIILTVYVDDILMTESDEVSISTTKAYLQQHLSILYKSRREAHPHLTKVCPRHASRDRSL
ncbi:unnamed protein product [Spirodela intermedia]|uniref:Uncharacterized protein n=1 Tax=Spirodela intermedia TaxID=51605 RepID=A0A7I8L5N7_SPIIN|nr:unnamed protein product [Spirodela intermedia]